MKLEFTLLASIFVCFIAMCFCVLARAETVEEFGQRLNNTIQLQNAREYERIETEQRKFNANIAAAVEQGVYGITRQEALQNQLILQEIAKPDVRRESKSIFIFGDNR